MALDPSRFPRLNELKANLEAAKIQHVVLDDAGERDPYRGVYWRNWCEALVESIDDIVAQLESI